MIDTCKQRWGVLMHRCTEPKNHNGPHQCECNAWSFYKARRVA